MGKPKKITTNSTLLRLKGTPFKTAAALKASEDVILREEWHNVERARVRHELFLRDGNQLLMNPFTKGIQARYVTATSNDNLVHVFLTAEQSVQVNIDNEMRNKNATTAIESLVKSLVTGLMDGYLGALGLRSDPNSKDKAPARKPS